LSRRQRRLLFFKISRIRRFGAAEKSSFAIMRAAGNEDLAAKTWRRKTQQRNEKLGRGRFGIICRWT
jgi:hypothetical protein